MRKSSTMAIALAGASVFASSTAIAEPPCRIVRVAVDADVEFTGALFGGDTSAAEAYITSLVDAVSDIFERDLNIELQPVFVRAFGAEPDPYSSTNASTLLQEVRSEFNAQPGIGQDVAFLLSGKNLSGAIVAMTSLNSICSPDQAHSLISELSGSFPAGTPDFDAGNNDPYYFARGVVQMLGGASLRTFSPGADPCVVGCGTPQGTIMSSCFGCGGASQIEMAFHPDQVQRVEAFLHGAGCDLACTTSCLADWNGDGELLTNDFIAYLNDFTTVQGGGSPVFGDPDLADPSGVLNTADLLAYLNEFVAGCQ